MKTLSDRQLKKLDKLLDEAYDNLGEAWSNDVQGDAVPYIEKAKAAVLAITRVLVKAKKP